MLSYVINDNEVLRELEQEKIRFFRDRRSWFRVDLELEHLETYKCKDGQHLVVKGTWLSILGYDTETISKIPGRYFDNYSINDQDAVAALKRNGYTVTFLEKTEYHAYYEVNAYIPLNQECVLPDGTKLFYPFLGEGKSMYLLKGTK